MNVERTHIQSIEDPALLSRVTKKNKTHTADEAHPLMGDEDMNTLQYAMVSATMERSTVPSGILHGEVASPNGGAGDSRTESCRQPGVR